MTLTDKQRQIVAEFSAIRDPQQRLQAVVNHGRRVEPLPDSLRTDEHRVEGCLSRLWFVPALRDGRCHFQTDSDSVIVRGVAAILAECYNGCTPEEILAHDPAFLREVGITQHLTGNRRNALSRLWAEMQNFAREQIQSIDRECA
jgi:cysteine desulfuration protein SufE